MSSPYYVLGRRIEPYFGRMRIRTSGRSRDVLLGTRSFVDPSRGVALVDWRKAPLSEVFFTCDPGEEYEIEVDGMSANASGAAV